MIFQRSTVQRAPPCPGTDGRQTCFGQRATLSPERNGYSHTRPITGKTQCSGWDENAFHDLMKEAYGNNYHASVAENIPSPDP